MSDAGPTPTPTPAPETPRPLVRFDRSDAIFVAACIAVAAICTVVAVRGFSKAFPEASIDFKVTRAQSEDVASEWLTSHALLPASGALPARHAASFTWDDTARLFLERSFGQEGANARMSSDIRLWRWGHRWFTPLEKEEVRAFVTPGGELVAFEHLVPEDAPGASLSEDDARSRAETFGRDVLGRSADRWELIESKSTARPHRVDWTFTWKRRGEAQLEPLDSSYRASVTVRGDAIGGFDEWVQVPEKWTRDYEAMRSKNETAGAVDSIFLVATVLACFGMLLWQARGRNVPWKLCFGLAAVGAVLVAGSQLNGLPQAFWNYDTTSSWSGFLSLRLLGALGAGLGLGLFIFVLTGGAEPVYRGAFGGQVALSRLFSRRGIGTRTFFRSVVLGLTLTAFFIGYQVVFYIVATKNGAWAPQEVAYDDLLNTRFPWISILFMGFMPAVTEEFMSRMFSIPFLGSLLRSRWLAVVVAAAIWGFGHAAYPNQPFWIRGLEVGLAGVIIGAIMMRFGILATLVWHYTVDALLTGLLLLRSESLYYKATAALAIGWTLVPLALALVAYARRGGFVNEEGMRNSDLAGPAPRVSAEPVTEPAPAHQPLGHRALIAAGVVVAVAIALMLVPRPSLDDAARVSVNRAEAIAAADARVRERGDDPAAFQHSAILMTAVDPVDAKFLLSRDPSMQALVNSYRGDLLGAGWRVRLFKRGEKEEWRLLVRADRAEVAGEHHLLDESAPGADLSKEAAEVLAVGFLRASGVDLAKGASSPEATAALAAVSPEGVTVDVRRDGWTQKEASAEKRPHRTDWKFEWEDSRSMRHVVGVAGDKVVEHQMYLKVPEEFERDRQRFTLAKALLLGARVVLLSAAVVAGLILLVLQFRDGRVPVRTAARWAGIAALVVATTTLLSWPLVLDRYDTTTPWPLFVTLFAVSLATGALLVGVGAFLVIGLVAAVEPGRVRPLAGHVRDAVIGALCFRAVMVISGNLSELAAARWPSAALPDSPNLPRLDAAAPAAAVVAGWLFALVFIPAAIGIAAHVHARWLRPSWMRALLLGVAVLAVVPLDARTPSEWVIGSVIGALTVVGVYAVIRWLWRGNALAYVLGVGLAGIAPALALLRQPLPISRIHGALALAVMLGVMTLAAVRARPLTTPS